MSDLGRRNELREILASKLEELSTPGLTDVLQAKIADECAEVELTLRDLADEEMARQVSKTRRLSVRTERFIRNSYGNKGN